MKWWHISLFLSFFHSFVSFLVITSIKPCLILFSCNVSLSPICSSSFSPFTSPHSLHKKIKKTLQRWCYRQWEWRRCKFWNIYIWISRLWSIYENKRIRYRTRQGQHYIRMLLWSCLSINSQKRTRNMETGHLYWGPENKSYINLGLKENEKWWNS